MAAVRAVFDTYELLEAVLLAVPPGDVNRKMRVRSTWRDIVENSARLQHHRVLRTMSKPLHNVDRPQYQSEEPIRVHRILNPVEDLWEDPETGVKYQRLYIALRFYEMTTDELSAVWHEHSFLPPCEKLQLCLRGYARDCILYVKDGIRVKDVVEIADAMCYDVRQRMENKSRGLCDVEGLLMNCNLPK